MEIGYRCVMGLNAIKDRESKLDQAREKIEHNINFLKENLKHPILEVDEYLCDALGKKINAIDPSGLSWQDPEANMVLCDKSKIIENLGDRQKRVFMQPRENMRCTLPDPVVSNYDIFVENFKKSWVPREMRNIFHNNKWKDSNSVLVKVVDRILAVLGEIWNNPAFATRASCDEQNRRRGKKPDIMAIEKYKEKLSPRYGHCAVPLENKLHFIGGEYRVSAKFFSNGSDMVILNEYIYLDLSKSFSLNEPLPIINETYIPGLSSLQGAVCSLGGKSKDIIYAVTDLTTYSLDTKNPKSWINPTLVNNNLIDNKMVSYSGGVSDSNEKLYIYAYAKMNSDMVILDTINLTWNLGSKVNGPVGLDSYVVVLLNNNKLLYIGGSKDDKSTKNYMRTFIGSALLFSVVGFFGFKYYKNRNRNSDDSNINSTIIPNYDNNNNNILKATSDSNTEVIVDYNNDVYKNVTSDSPNALTNEDVEKEEVEGESKEDGGNVNAETGLNMHLDREHDLVKYW
nr:12601_t:CDS:2 [Entrophospora candida]